jgi:hypothetical protein
MVEGKLTPPKQTHIIFITKHLTSGVRLLLGKKRVRQQCLCLKIRDAPIHPSMVIERNSNNIGLAYYHILYILGNHTIFNDILGRYVMHDGSHMMV